MPQFVIALCLFTVSCLVAWVLRKQKPSAPTQSELRIPQQLDRNDFSNPEKPWLIVSFTSDECDSCKSVSDATALVESSDVGLQIISVQDNPKLHDRYHVTQIPLTLLCSADGVVVEQWVGPLAAPHLWAALAKVRS